MIEHLFTKLVDTQRLVRDETDDTEVWENELENVACHIQTWAGGEIGYDGAGFMTYTMWCDIGIDIIKGDRIIDEMVVYEVLEVEKLDMGKNPHLQLTLSLIKQ